MIEILEKLSLEFKDISDFHLRANSNLAYRRIGDIIIDPNVSITNDDMQNLMETKCNPKDIEKFKKTNELDCGFLLGEVRFRANFFRTLQGIAGVFRRVETKVPTMESLNLPPILYDAVVAHKGLVLVTGPTGSGKSTTLAAIINKINQTRPANIITIEDPVEFIHHDQKSIVSHREVGKQTEDFAAALHSALREDPDVILVGELRDLETISAAVTAAEMGILVMGTLHTNGAGQTVDRIINSFPADKLSHNRTMISTSLRGVISQQLLPTIHKPGRAAALEIMINTSAVANLIRQGKLDQLETAIQSGGASGMQAMDKALMDLVEKGWISGYEAYLQANNKHKFEEVKDMDT